MRCRQAVCTIVLTFPGIFKEFDLQRDELIGIYGTIKMRSAVARF